jgi:uncharacterized protein YbjT (DUF2867 family)
VVDPGLGGGGRSCARSHFQSKARVEAVLRDSSVPWTVVAPSYFYLGAVIAAILGRREEHLSQRVEVAGDAPTPEEMAAALGAQAVETSVQELAEHNPDLAAMYTFLARTGYGIDVSALRARYPEVAWSRFADWAGELALT